MTELAEELGVLTSTWLFWNYSIFGRVNNTNPYSLGLIFHETLCVNLGVCLKKYPMYVLRQSISYWTATSIRLPLASISKSTAALRALELTGIQRKGASTSLGWKKKAHSMWHISSRSVLGLDWFELVVIMSWFELVVIMSRT